MVSWIIPSTLRCSEKPQKVEEHHDKKIAPLCSWGYLSRLLPDKSGRDDL